ncbi:MAG: TetR family transcriptional regulator, partial [Comamonadaceae bacterium CG17_big_fil_post_rev_8_21_14_2_50_60_13]
MNVLDKPAKQATEVRQAHLVAAAIALAARRSPADITTTDLARMVGISQGAVFKHFASKEAIWLAVLDWTATTLMARLEAAAQGVRDAVPSELSALRAVFLAHVDFVMAYPGVPRVIFQELQSARDTALKAQVRSLMQRYRKLLQNLLQQAHKEQGLHADIDLNAAAVLFIGSVQGLVTQALISGDVNAMAQ